jgi:4'-phosphopantetheinyl transferase
MMRFAMAKQHAESPDARPYDWSPAPASVRLEPHAVHIWRAFLDRPKQQERFLATLADDERARAARFVFPRDRGRFVAGRAILRNIIARYLGGSAGDIEFAYEDAGKPTVRLRPSDPPLRFNVSHSHDLAVYAFAHGRAVGIDVEAINSQFCGDDIAEQFFSPAEGRELAALTREQRREAFFLGWTRKEAYIKAHGGGLAIPLHAFDVTLSPGSPVRLRSIDSERWTLQAFDAADDYAGAVVAEGSGWDMRLWEWS